MITECSEAQSFPFPRDVVAGVIDDRLESGKVVKELIGAGFADSDIHLFHGEEAAECIDAAGGHRGRIRHTLRFLHWLLSEEVPMLSEYEMEARAGHQIFFVKVHCARQARHAAVILDLHHAHAMRHFGRWLITELSGSSQQNGIPVGDWYKGRKPKRIRKLGPKNRWLKSF